VPPAGRRDAGGALLSAVLMALLFAQFIAQ
jgi:hypothetical protein